MHFRTPVSGTLLAAIALFAAACGGESPRRSRFQQHERPEVEAPLFLFAVDGFEWSAILPLLHEGRMPVLESLIERGVAGQIKSMKPTLSPRLWATIATGKLPHVHGIKDFVQRIDGKNFAYTSSDRRVKAFWNILGEYGVSSDTIGWWTTYPVEPVHGLMVAQVNTKQAGRNIEKGTVAEDVPDQVWPAEENERVLTILREVEAEIPDQLREIFGEFDVELSEEQRRRWEECEWSFRADAVYAAIAQDRIERGVASEVVSLYMGGTDVVGHRFWAAHFPEQAGFDADSAEVQAFGNVVNSYYTWVDQILGRMLELLPPETTVLVVSDHGMTLNVGALEKGRPHKFTGVHYKAEPGAFLAAGTGITTPPADRPPARKIERSDLPLLGSIFDICPTLLVLRGVPFGRDMHGRPLRSILDPQFLKRHRPRRVPSMDGEEWLRSRTTGPAVEEADERLEQLRNLGYLGDESESE